MAKKALRKGLFITFEGPEGCGKSTHSRLLYDYLKTHSYDCIYTREPGGTNLGELLRRILLGSKDRGISDIAELFLFEACRAQIVEEVIRPNLARKKIVICDRFSDATISYQGYGGKIPLETIEALNSVAAKGIEPDLTILLDIDTVTGLKRATKKGIDRMELKTKTYHRRVRNGYLELSRKNPKRIKIIKAKGAIDKIQSLVRSEVEIVIQRYKRSG